MALQPQWPVCCRTTILGNTQFRVKPLLGLFFRSSLRYQEVRIKFVPCIQASSGYLKRRHKKSLIPKTKASTPGGFAPRPLVGTSTQKKDQNDTKEQEIGTSNQKIGQNDTQEKEALEAPSSGKDAVSRSRLTDRIFTGESQMAEADSMSAAATVDAEYNIKEMGTGNEEYGHDLRSQHVKVDHSDKIVENEVKIDQFNEVGRQVAFGDDQVGRTSIAEKTSTVDGQEGNPATNEKNLDKDDIDESAEVLNAKDTMIDTDDSLLKQREEIDAQEQRKRLENLADETFSRGNKIFVVPEVVTPDQVIKVFLNRSLSALATEPDVLIMGGYNGWRWKFFTEKMKKTNLKGDWWSCELCVPKEAYRMDFVFFNGADIYENNDYKDFSLSMKGSMDETKFEEFLLEEKKKELERLAAKENEKKRLEEEQRQRAAEKAAAVAERAQAKAQVEKRRQGLHHVMRLASQSAHDVWQIDPTFFEGGDKIKLHYNRSSRPLAHASEIWIHGGHNNWSEGLSIVEKLSCSEKADGDWWCADVVVPDQALVLDWVFADGPPGKAVGYDNNNRKDFHATVPKSMPEELFWVEEEHRIFRKVQEERRAREEALHKKIEKTERMKAETKERTMKMFLLSQKHIVYTEPIDVQAGNMVTIFYNPSNTILNGKPEVWFRCSFNRWSHPNGPLPPQKMVLAENGSHLKATVKVPIDAYMMDFVFSEKEDGGLYDNRNQMDYHIPVTGSLAKEPPMHIVHIAVEMAPIAKVGGLGDVVTSLSRAVQDLGHKIDIILPNYNCMKLNNVKDFQYHNSFAWGGTEIKVMFGKVEGLSVYFLEPQNGMFSVGCIYGRNDDGPRFSFFCHAALEFLLQSGFQPDILHCHDWSSAPVAWLFKEHYIHYGLSNSRVVFTIHNLEFGIQHIGRAMRFADKATTVSQTYSREISGNPAISPHLFKFHGIVNGIDPDIWDPYNDQFIPVPYTAENVVEGKKAAKSALQERLGLRRLELPLVGIISRLTVQKGIHLIKHAVGRTLERNGQVVLLGSAPDSRIQNDFVNLGNQLHNSHADRARFCLTYDEPLSHLIYAGADFILVPSLFEPCGLTQLIAMRYGSIPVVRKTGGLYDTVFDVDNDKERAQAQGLEPNGFSFEGTDAGGVDYALNRSISAWLDAREWFYSLCKRVMEQDWSWNRPALDYMELYHSARK